MSNDTPLMVGMQVAAMQDEENKVVKALLDGMIVKYQTKQLVGGLTTTD